MSQNTQQPTNDPLTGQRYKNSNNDNIYDVPNNIIISQQVIPREHENNYTRNIEMCYKS